MATIRWRNYGAMQTGAPSIPNNPADSRNRRVSVIVKYIGQYLCPVSEEARGKLENPVSDFALHVVAFLAPRSGS